MTGTPSEQNLVDRPHVYAWYMQRYSETEKEWQDLYVFNEANLALQRDFNVMRKLRDFLCMIPTSLGQVDRASTPLGQTCTVHSLRCLYLGCLKPGWLNSRCPPLVPLR